MALGNSQMEISPRGSEQSEHAILPIQTFSEHRREKSPHFEPEKRQQKITIRDRPKLRTSF